MCYKIVCHTLRCDVRPLVSVSDDVAKPLVDPYAAPNPCDCEHPDPKIQPRLRCDFGHNCCFMTAKHVSCRKEDCGQVVTFHKYTRPDISREVLLERGPAKDDEGWAPLPVIDGECCDLGFAPGLTAEFVRAREKFQGIHLMSSDHQSCLFLEHNWERLCGHLTQNKWQCNAEEDIEDLDGELELLGEDAKALRGRQVDAYFGMTRLHEEGHGDIMGLYAWI